jgi:GNAT superfamily N-acetyltransferase
MPADPLRIVPVEGRAAGRKFIELPYRLYRDDPHWVPPLRMMEGQRWSPRHNASLRARWARRFLALRGGRVVGRVAAVVDEPFAARWCPGIGFFGFFECEDDPEAAAALLATAEDTLRGQGMTGALGPVNLSTHDETGLLVDGFGAPPTVLSPYNPPHYAALLEAAGYAGARDFHAYLWTPESRPTRAVERLLAAARGAAAGRVTVRPVDPERFDEEVRAMHAVYNASFQDVWGFVPIPWDEFAERAKEFKQFYRPELALLAESDGAVVGFGLVLPDVNEALARAKGRLLPLGWLKIMRAVPRIRGSRFILLGVLPEYTGRGVAVLISQEMAESARRIGIAYCELSLVQAENRRVRHVIESFGCPPVRTFRLYEKRF